MIILGIDPGLAIVGYGVVEYQSSRFRTLGYGAILTPAGTKTADRLVSIGKEMDRLLALYQPSQMAVEELFFSNNRTTGIVVAEARGVILEHARKAGLEIAEYTPSQVKQAVVGYGKAEKKQVIQMVRQILRIGDGLKLDDTADALAIAICHAHSGGREIEKYRICGTAGKFR